jgi:hypothetical protein
MLDMIADDKFQALYIIGAPHQSNIPVLSNRMEKRLNFVNWANFLR